MTRITICSVGSRGDVQPYIALGLGLKEKGHEVTIATEKRMEYLVAEFGLEYAQIDGDSCGLLFEPKAQKVLQEGSLFGLIKLTSEWDKKFDKRKILGSYVEALKGAQIVVGAGLTLTQTYTVAQYYHAAWLPMILGPTVATSEFPVWPLAFITFGCSCLNKWTYKVLFSTMWNQEKVHINPWRESLGLSPISTPSGIVNIMETSRPTTLIACSTLISGPHRRVPADYPANVKMEGFIFVPSVDESSISPELQQFFLIAEPGPFFHTTSGAVHAQKPVLYFGFGSMPAPDPLALLKIAMDVCTSLRCRGVLVAGWSEVFQGAGGDGNENEKEKGKESGSGVQQQLEAMCLEGTLLVVKAAPHEWIFPKVDCIVHHCGVGE